MPEVDVSLPVRLTVTRAVTVSRGREYSPSAIATVALVMALGILAPAEHVVPTLLSDSYMTLFSGRWIAEHGIPHAEVFTIAARGHPWIDQQWLAQLADYKAWAVAGYGGVALLSVTAIGLAFGLLSGLMIRRQVPPLVTVAASAIGIVVILPASFVRAQTFAFPLFSLLLWICLTDAEHDDPRLRLLWLVPLLALWANVHGSVLLGAGLAAAYLAFRAVQAARRGRMKVSVGCAGLALACLGAIAATPYGTEIVRYYSELVGNGAIAAAAPEWRPPHLWSLAFVWLVALTAVALAALVTTVRAGHQVDKPLVAAALVAGISTAAASRDEVWFTMVAALVIADGGRLWLRSASSSPRLTRMLTATAVLVAAAGIAAMSLRDSAFYQRLTPVRVLHVAARYAAAHPCTRILADNDAASALLWYDPRLAGRIGFDARLELYPQAELRRWIAFQSGVGPAWASTFHGYEILIASTVYDPALAQRLSTLPTARRLARQSTGEAVAISGSQASCR